MKKNHSTRSAFTLIELLVVISVLGVLVAVMLPNLLGVRARARDSAKKNDLRQLKTAIRMYYNDFQFYPADDDDGNIVACGANGNLNCPNNDESFAIGDKIYMKEMISSDQFDYVQLSGGEDFLLSTVMENSSDTDISDSAARCNVASPVSAAYYICAD